MSDGRFGGKNDTSLLWIVLHSTKTAKISFKINGAMER